jgi:hypothetical protein
MVAPLPPSGQQVEIFHGDQRAVVVEVGGGRGFPWPNRLQDGSHEFARRRHRLPLTEPGRQNAIHGLVRWEGWTVDEWEPDRSGHGARAAPEARLPAGAGTRVARWVDADYGYGMVFSGDPLPEVARRWPASNRAGR